MINSFFIPSPPNRHRRWWRRTRLAPLFHRCSVRHVLRARHCPALRERPVGGRNAGGEQRSQTAAVSSPGSTRRTESASTSAGCHTEEVRWSLLAELQNGATLHFPLYLRPLRSDPCRSGALTGSSVRTLSP